MEPTAAPMYLQGHPTDPTTARDALVDAARDRVPTGQTGLRPGSVEAAGADLFAELEALAFDLEDLACELVAVSAPWDRPETVAAPMGDCEVATSLLIAGRRVSTLRELVRCQRQALRLH